MAKKRKSKFVRCRTCGRVIVRKRLGLKKRMSRIRRHYKQFHRAKFRAGVKRGVRTRGRIR